MSFLKKSPLRAIACLLILASSLPMAAADEDNKMNALLECTTLQDDARRLECFDNATAETASVATALDEPAEVAPAAVALLPALSPVEEFGMNATLEEQSAVEGQTAKLTEMIALVTHVRERLYGELVVTLENGQVWTEKDSEYGFRIKEGDTITIRRGRLGGYRMVSIGNRSSQVVRVK
jgi:hypothetical protein